MKEIMKVFNDYAKTFDLKNPNIMHKFHHSYRVMEFAKEIAMSLNLNDEDIMLAQIIGLYHDIARFEQWTKYETYVDSKSINHGDYGYKILKEELIDKIITDKEKQNIILKSVKNHNKYKIEDGLSDREMLFSKIVRDADKIDIMKEQGIIKEEEKVNDEILQKLYNHEMITNDLVNSEMDGLIRLISFIFDFNYKYTYEYILNNNIIQNKINLIEIYGNLDLKDLEENLINYMKERL